jgi:hypothetical protein
MGRRVKAIEIVGHATWAHLAYKVPMDAKIVGAMTDYATMNTRIVVEHPSFEETEYYMEVPLLCMVGGEGRL